MYIYVSPLWWVPLPRHYNVDINNCSNHHPPVFSDNINTPLKKDSSTTYTFPCVASFRDVWGGWDAQWYTFKFAIILLQCSDCSFIHFICTERQIFRFQVHERHGTNKTVYIFAVEVRSEQNQITSTQNINNGREIDKKKKIFSVDLNGRKFKLFSSLILFLHASFLHTNEESLFAWPVFLCKMKRDKKLF